MSMNDDDIARALREIPRESASRDFTAGVLEGIDRIPLRRARRRRGYALGVASIVAAGLLVAFLRAPEAPDSGPASPRSAARVESLREEYRELQSELDELRRLTSELEPVIELGGTDRVDFVFDIGELSRRNDVPRTKPVSHSERP